MADLLTDTFVRIWQKLKFSSGRLLPDDQDAEDVLQDCFVRLWQRQYQLDSEKEAEVLLAKTVRNASINAKRRKHFAHLAADYPVEGDIDEDRERYFSEMQESIRTELTEKQRYILEEKEYGGRTLEDIARELKMEPAAVRMQLSRARKILRNALKNDR